MGQLLFQIPLLPAVGYQSLIIINPEEICVIMSRQTINLTAATRMSEAVSENPFLLLLLEHLGIELPLLEKSACEVASEYGIDCELLLTFMRLYGDLSYNTVLPFTGSEVPSILVYLRNSHRYYSEEVYPGIVKIISEMNLEVHSGETAMIEEFFLEYLSEVKNHFDYEEETVFPYITRLYDAYTGQGLKEDAGDYSVEEYKEHHDDIEEKLDDLKSLLIDYLPRGEEGNTRRILLMKLYELEHDLKRHSRIEDYILIPLVAAMESRLA